MLPPSSSFLFLSINSCNCKEIHNFARYLLDYSRTRTFLSNRSLSIVYLLNIVDVRGQEMNLDAIQLISKVMTMFSCSSQTSYSSQHTLSFILSPSFLQLAIAILRYFATPSVSPLIWIPMDFLSYWHILPFMMLLSRPLWNPMVLMVNLSQHHHLIIIQFVGEVSVRINSYS